MSDVEELLKEYKTEVNIAASSFYAWKNINNIAASNEQILNRVRRNSLSWNLILHSLQCTFFVALGRIFDNDKRSLTARRFIEHCLAVC